MSNKNKNKVKSARRLKRKLARKQRKNQAHQFVKIEVPVVQHINDFTLESFKSYYSRWPKNLRNIPKNIVEQWVYRHNETFLEMWSELRPHKWSFQRKNFSVKECLGITHLPREIEHYEDVGNRYIRQVNDRDFLSNYMLQHGKFPQPIIVARGASAILHPKGAHLNEFMTDNQLIEGHRRLGLLRAMFKNEMKLKSKQKVWVMRINT
ncbi:hypothetical protein [Vibrio paucivorans]